MTHRIAHAIAAHDVPSFLTACCEAVTRRMYSSPASDTDTDDPTRWTYGYEKAGY